MKHVKIFLILLVIGIFAAGFFANAIEYKTAQCTCKCGTKTISAKGFGTSSDDAQKSCDEMCARNCGSATECPTDDVSDCTKCCKEKVCGSFAGDAKAACQESCENTCGFRSILKGLTDLIYTAAGIIAAIMLVVHGLKFITSQDPDARRNAKNAILYVILALVIIGIAKFTVDTFANNLAGTGTTTTIPQVQGCGGVILNKDQIKPKITGDEVEIYVSFINNGDKKCHYKVVIYNLKDEQVDDEPETGWFDVEGGVEETARIKSGGAGWNVNALRNGYKIKLMLGSPREVKDEYVGQLP